MNVYQLTFDWQSSKTSDPHETTLNFIAKDADDAIQRLKREWNADKDFMFAIQEAKLLVKDVRGLK